MKRELRVGDKVRVIIADAQHYGKRGVIAHGVSICDCLVEFSGDQRVWLDEGDTYVLPYRYADIELIEEDNDEQA